VPDLMSKSVVMLDYSLVALVTLLLPPLYYWIGGALFGRTTCPLAGRPVALAALSTVPGTWSAEADWVRWIDSGKAAPGGA